MNIVFINTPLQDYGEVPKQEYTTTPPLGLGYLATIAKNLGNNVRLIDAEASGFSLEQTVNYALNESPDMVGINLLTPTLNVSRGILQEIRRKNSKVQIIAGGPHATICPRETMKEIPEIDILVRGEGEITLQELLENNDLKQIQGISYRKSGKVNHNPDRPLNENLDSLPFIDRSFFANDPQKDEPGLKSVMISARGCPYRCSFCSGPLVLGRQIRTRSIDNVISEIGELAGQYGVKSIHFLDNEFIFNKERVLEYTEKLMSRGLDIQWRALSRVDLISRFGEEFLQKIKDAGCYQLVFGIESGNKRILDMVDKGTTPEQAREAIRLCKKVGIKTKAYYMFGFPTETVPEMEQTLNHAIELDTDIAYFLLVKAYPGTTMYDQIARRSGESGLQDYTNLQGVVCPERENPQVRNFGKYNIGNTNPISDVSTEDLHDMLRKAYKVYYADGRRKE